MTPRFRIFPPIFCALLIGMASGARSINFAVFFFIPVVWFMAPSRFAAYLAAFVFYLSVSYGIVASAPIYFDLGANIWRTVRYLSLLWVGSSLTLALPWGLLWTDMEAPFRSKALRLLGVLVLVAFPPLGMWGWGNPLLCAGYLLPRTREAGIVLLLLVWPALWHCARKNRYGSRGAFWAAIAVIALYAAYMSPSQRLQARTAEDWQGLYTPFGLLYSGSSDAMSAYMRYRMLSVVLEKTTAKYVVLPETIAGWWGSPTEDLWRPTTELFASQGRTLFVGAETALRGTKKYYNVVQIRGNNHGTVEQRCPVPIGMWNPFREKSVVANWFGGTGIAEIDGLSVGILVCYEPYLYYPCLVTLTRRPDVLVVVSNSWWSRTTNIPLLSDKSVTSWALLFDVPLVLSKNI
ncbi:MAG: hypothetical protein LBR71_04255 [Synergistaceae bacterium]|jgi:hypothetical protein|nr:hypothetical protein [Synergistaceae bacterium]